MRGNRTAGNVMLAAIALVAAAPGTAIADDPFADMLAGKSAMKGNKLDQAIAQAEAHPLGSKENPVRVDMPRGQFVYLSTLRCTDGRPPKFNRTGNFGIGVFGNIIDGYDLRCEGSEPATTKVFMDMYHAGHVETRPVPGFTISPK